MARHVQFANRKTIFSKQMNREEIIKYIRRNKNINKRMIKERTTSKILSLYFEIMLQAVLDGQLVSLIDGTKISVVKTVLKKPKIWLKNRIFKKPDQQFVYNPKRIGLDYKFLIESDFLKEQKYNFSLSNKWCLKLHKILTTTDKEYISYEH